MKWAFFKHLSECLHIKFKHDAVDVHATLRDVRTGGKKQKSVVWRPVGGNATSESCLARASPRASLTAHGTVATLSLCAQTWKQVYPPWGETHWELFIIQKELEKKKKIGGILDKCRLPIASSQMKNGDNRIND